MASPDFAVLFSDINLGKAEFRLDYQQGLTLLVVQLPVATRFWVKELISKLYGIISPDEVAGICTN